MKTLVEGISFRRKVFIPPVQFDRIYAKKLCTKVVLVAHQCDKTIYIVFSHFILNHTSTLDSKAQHVPILRNVQIVQ